MRIRTSTYEAVILPIVTYGDCRRSKLSKGSRSCNNFNVALGDGLCVECWDKGARIRTSRKETG